MPYYNERLMLAREKRGLTQKESWIKTTTIC